MGTYCGGAGERGGRTSGTHRRAVGGCRASVPCAARARAYHSHRDSCRAGGRGPAHCPTATLKTEISATVHESGGQ